MLRHWPRLLTFIYFVLLALPASAQHEGIRWQHDLEAAKTLARQSNKLVLVHFWTPSCGPCVTLEQTVFNQPGVAAAIDAQFVPVKLNANENAAAAQAFGITRVPTDVIITPEGEIVDKMVSPPTPVAYVAEMTQAANARLGRSGATFAQSAAAAPAQPQLNAAYANLPVAPSTPPAVAAQLAANRSTSGTESSPSSIGTKSQQPTTNPFGQSTTNSFAQSPVAPPLNQPATPATTSAAISLAPHRVANPQVGTPPASPPLAPVAPATPVSPVMPNSQYSSQSPVAATQAPATKPTTASNGTTATASDPGQLPPGAPPLGFEGYCPVSMRNHWKWVPGNSQWGIVHRGRTYWFAGQSEQQQFWSDPDRYSPALSGMDPVMSVDHDQQVPGKREHSIDYDSLFYMFCSEATLQQFTANPEKYAVGVRQAMGIARGRLVK